MSRKTMTMVFVLAISFCQDLPARQSQSGKERFLALIPFPKKVSIEAGQMELATGLVTSVSGKAFAALQVAGDLNRELKQIVNVDTGLQMNPMPTSDRNLWLAMLSAKGVCLEEACTVLADVPDHNEGYQLVVKEDFVAIGSKTRVGLFGGIQTLRQLIRSNTENHSISCLNIRDWPSIEYRGFQDDLTRGPSTKLDMLQEEVRIGSLLKQNFFTYYMEHQFEFAKHPVIGPAGGCLTPEELEALVQYAKLYHMEIIGNQQSFGHFHHILKHEQYKNLQEVSYIINPTDERSYQLLDDMYLAQIPCLESRFFNVCCDETHGLGTGPSKPVAERIGIGGLYAQHIRRIYEIISGKYNKTMMMWGDVILQHPEHLDKIPKDVIMLSWGYEPLESFEQSIVPFVNSGYEFFVCPGVSCWNRILPDFRKSVVNIQNYVRDGTKHGALGVLNTAWDDDGENFFAPNLYGIAWGAECAWNGSATDVKDFNRRIGAVLFGESGDYFGQTIELLGQTHYLGGYNHMLNRRFWETALGEKVDHQSAKKEAEQLLGVIDPVLEDLRKLEDAAVFNREFIDYYVFGAERMKLMADRTLGVLEVIDVFEQSLSTSGPRKSVKLLKQAKVKLEKLRDRHENLKIKYSQLWLRENKPYALDWVTKRFDALIEKYDVVIKKLQQLMEKVDQIDLQKEDLKKKIMELG